jgi:aspartate carbamoyltransferase catalytic subunit
MRTRRSLIDLDEFSRDEIDWIFSRTQDFEGRAAGALLEGVDAVTLFFEQSTRTFTSFNLALMRLGANVVNLTPGNLSLATKGETLEDTMLTLEAMGISVVIVRHSQAGVPAQVAAAFDGHTINAGDGTHAHPTQALLDLFTLHDEFGDLTGRSVAIVGDIAHSRVAHSTIRGLLRLNAEPVLVGPSDLLHPDDAVGGARLERDLDRVIPDVDAIILLRVQRERFASMTLSDREYIAGYQLNAQRLKKLAGHAVIMHPGPYNRGMELDDTVLEWAGWRYARQVHHGVFIRMAVLDLLVNGVRERVG